MPKCDLCERPAAVDYRLRRPGEMFRFWCSRCAASVLFDAPAKDYAGMAA